MSLANVTDAIKAKIGDDSGLGTTLKFDFGDDGVIFVDATQSPNAVSNDNSDAECTVKVTMDDFNGIMAGDLDAMTAFMMGKLKVEGNMGVAMKLSSLLG